jgi:hypothetical protein
MALMKIKILLLIGLFYLTISGTKAQKLILKISNDLESSVDSIPWTNKHTSRKGAAHSGESFSSTDSVNAYGFGYKGPFPLACQGKNLKINFNDYVRVSKTGTLVYMVITVSFGDSVISWTSKDVSGRIKKAGEWTKIEDTIEFPSLLTGPGYNLAVYLWNSDGKAVVDIDDLNIEFMEKGMPSFLPAGFSVLDEKEGWQKMPGNNKVSLFYNKYSGQVKILNESGDTLISALAYYSEWLSKNKKEKNSFWNYRFNLQKDSVTEEGVYYLLNSKNDFSENKLLILAGTDGSLAFRVSTIFVTQVSMLRHSLITDFTLQVSEVFKKSTLTDTENFSDEYWLGKEGFTVSNKRSSFILYRPHVSSLQLDVRNTLAVFNLDYSADHPLLHFPLMKKSEGKFEDCSFSVFGAGDFIQSEFVYQSVKPSQKMARIMSNPYGYEASFIWTEHADYTNIQTHRAVYLGADTINSLNDATGGFLRNSIPVTKSIFYSNPDKVDNADKAGFMKGPVATYKETEGFADFIRLLYETGNEICLHTPDHFTSERKLIAEALEGLKRSFPSTTWIDHGYDNSVRSNREDLACDGADSTSKWYAGDLWKKYGIKYFWNSFYEDSAPFKDYAFNSFFSVPYAGWDDAFPTPLYWRNKTRTGDIVHWRTNSTLDPADGSLWAYYFNDLRLSDAINNRDNVIIHCYPARVDSSNGFYVINKNVVTVNDEFNKALKKLSYFRQGERLRLTTIQGLLDHIIAAEKVSLSIENDGKIVIRNDGRELIKGLSLSTKALEVKAEKKEIATKKSGEELIFWFDISPDEVVTLTLK